MVVTPISTVLRAATRVTIPYMVDLGVACVCLTALVRILQKFTQS